MAPRTCRSRTSTTITSNEPSACASSGGRPDGVRAPYKDLRNSPEGGRGRYDDLLELPDGRIQVHGYMVLGYGGVGPKSSPTFTVRAGLVIHAQGWSAADDVGP
jgi:hypothetical protein